MFGLSRSGRIILLLGLNVVMFLAELIVGYKTSSLALIADAFHMLSDVLSQIIALYAIRLAARTEWQPTLSYGWQRAELLGALYNGVFLLALCFTILLDAIERFFKPEDIEEPKLVLIVGGIGLACNLLGLVLFHDHSGHGHSHSHGGHSHSHSKKEKKTVMPSSQPSSPASAADVADETNEKGEKPLRHSSSLDNISPLRQTNIQNLQHAASQVKKQLEDEERYAREDAASQGLSSLSAPSTTRSRVQSNNSTTRPDAVIVSMEGDKVLSTDDGHDHDEANNHNHDHDHGHGDDEHDHEHEHDHGESGKKGSKPSGEDLNMRGIFLHVLGDALGSVGVIFTALFIWLTDFSWRFYMDPIISICITAIIIHSAWPLVRSASFILLQGVPVGVEIEEIRREIKAIPDVISIHDLHIWQLTNIKMVASLHVLVTNQEAFERVSRAVKSIMHRAGVHSTTIQPEFPGMHPYYQQISQGAGLKNRRQPMSVDEDGKPLLVGSSTGMTSRATSEAAQSRELLGTTTSTSYPGSPVLGGVTDISAPDGVAVDTAEGGVVIVPGDGHGNIDESNCAMLCVDGEQACDVGSCCTLPVKR
ncbi:hypothetical protein BG004_004688 [Podila humilis]|nr:hypothetical protein BG004_004688 [Podila humilis]